MYPTKNRIGKVVILRPGALGDVLAVRGVIRLLRDAFPGVEIVLVAPGERGAFFCRPGWADRCFDWERSAFSWLFSGGESAPPATLRAIFSGCDCLLSYIDPDAATGWAALEARLDSVAPAAGKVYCPSRPQPGHAERIGEWLIRPAWAFCREYHLLPPEYVVNLPALASSRVAMPVAPRFACPYAVLHPGSGSGRKNWPLEYYAELARLFLAAKGRGGEARFAGVVIASGEADGDLGERLCRAVPGLFHLQGEKLTTLAEVLAGAALYVGNDSGVSHLAAAVADDSGRAPGQAVIFGPSDPSVWAPPGALVLHAGERMDDLPPLAAWGAIEGLFAF